MMKYTWILTILIAILGQFLPELGLLVPFIMLSLIVMSFFKGKYWCGNFCPHGSFYETFIAPLSRRKEVPAFLKSKVFIFLFLFFFLFNFIRRFFLIFSNLYHPLSQIGYLFSTIYLIVMLLGGILGLFFFPRTWCHFCPMGTIQSIFYRLGERFGVKKWDEILTISNPRSCRSCGLCNKVCPLQLKPYRYFDVSGQLTRKECIRCRTCIERCPLALLSLSKGKNSLEEMREDDLSPT